jgi:hypothetical protein
MPSPNTGLGSKLLKDINDAVVTVPIIVTEVPFCPALPV